MARYNELIDELPAGAGGFGTFQQCLLGIRLLALLFLRSNELCIAVLAGFADPEEQRGRTDGTVLILERQDACPPYGGLLPAVLLAIKSTVDSVVEALE